MNINDSRLDLLDEYEKAYRAELSLFDVGKPEPSLEQITEAVQRTKLARDTYYEIIKYMFHNKIPVSRRTK